MTDPEIEIQDVDSQVMLETLMLETPTKPSQVSFTVAKSVGSKRNILILGTARAGKYTIAKNIATDDKDFPPQDAEKGTGEVHFYEYQDYKFVIIDTAGARSKSGQVNEKSFIRNIKANIESYLEYGINLMILVVRKDCCTPEEINTLAKIVESLFTEETRNYIALVHTGCENFEVDERKKYMELFKRSEGPAKRLSSVCLKGAYAVGFPDLEQTSRNFFDLYEESVINSKQALRSLVKDSKCIHPYIELFSTRTLLFSGREWNCVLI